MRIASLAKSNTEILQRLGCAWEIVAATSYDSGHFEIVGSFTDIDVSKVAALKPDIAFTSTFLQEKYAKELESNGIEVIHFDPLSVDDVMRDILDAGKALGKEKGARKIVNNMEREISKVKKAVEGKNVVKVYAEEWPRPPMASGNWVIQMLEIAGGQGLLNQGEHSRKVSLEEVQKFDPDKIILNWCDIGLTADASLLHKREGWDSITAIKKGKIFSVDDSHFNTPSQNIILGIKELAWIIHGVKIN